MNYSATNVGKVQNELLDADDQDGHRTRLSIIIYLTAAQRFTRTTSETHEGSASIDDISLTSGELYVRI